MESPRYWGDKRYHTWNHHLRTLFGEKVFKVPLDAGFTCPNRDGTVGFGGCIFCSSRGSGDFAGSRDRTLSAQFRQVSEQIHCKWPKAKYIGYFQAYSNTYGPVEQLKEMYETILQEKDVVGLSIATRPDCLPGPVLDLLEELNNKTYLWVEMGLQSIHSKTLKLINRGHSHEVFLQGLEKLQQRNIRTCAHIILGLPGEGPAEMLETGKEIAALPLQGVKIHLLHLLKGTPMENLYEQGGLEFLEQTVYTELVVDLLELLPPEMVIHRLTGDGPPDQLLGPMWSRKKWEVLNGIDRALTDRNTWQGRLYEP
ncbi:MAG TPA: TIGR01212 family radical SAM protein [Candidatus Deferrimicrobium sp.]|nr:TIGR01212 family radical SAM protein [Candidatus Deferrimicrobium sp.]